MVYRNWEAENLTLECIAEERCFSLRYLLYYLSVLFLSLISRILLASSLFLFTFLSSFIFSRHTLTPLYARHSETELGLKLYGGKVKREESPFLVCRKNRLQMWDDEICCSIKGYSISFLFEKIYKGEFSTSFILEASASLSTLAEVSNIKLWTHL